MCFPRRRQGYTGPALMPRGRDSRLAGRDSWSQSPCGSIRPVPAPTCPHHLPQEHKAKVKASTTASFPAVGAAGARALTHGSSAQTRGHAHQLGQTGHTELGPHPQLVVYLSVCLPVHQNPEQSWSWVLEGQGWVPCRRIGLTKLQASSRSLKGSGLGAAGWQALGPEDSQGPRSLCPSLGHNDLSARGVGGGWPGVNFRSPSRPQLVEMGSDTSYSRWPLAWPRPGEQISGQTGGGQGTDSWWCGCLSR